MSDNQIDIENYNNPPIFLSILEIRYKDTKLEKIEQLSEYTNEIKKIFPNSQEQVVSELRLDNLLAGQPTVSIQNRKVDCFLFASEDNQSEFTISLDRFNYRQSGPYSNFESFTKNIKTVWTIYHELLKDISITGVSLRCFNKIEIKEQVNDPSEYFNISIQAENNIIPDIVTNYSIRYITNNLETRKHTIVSLSLESSIEDVFPFILDIDVHDENPMPNNLALLWKKFEVLRQEKNCLFNLLISEKTKSIFK